MRNYLENRKQFHTLFTTKNRVSAFFGGLFFATLIFIPIFIGFIEFMVVYMYLVYPITILIFVVTVLYFFTIMKLNIKALHLMNCEACENKVVKQVALFHLIVAVIVAALITFLFLVWWIPALLV